MDYTKRGNFEKWVLLKNQLLESHVKISLSYALESRPKSTRVFFFGQTETIEVFIITAERLRLHNP